MAASELDDLFSAPHEQAVRNYLASELDPQVGRAEERFRQFLATEQFAPRQRNIFRLPERLGGWTAGVLGAALAASLAALWAGPSLRQVTPQLNHPGNTPPASMLVPNPMLVEQDVQSQTFDDGTYMIDGNTPVRILRRRDLERTRWFDKDQNLQGEQLVPQDHVVYVQVKTY